MYYKKRMDACNTARRHTRIQQGPVLWWNCIRDILSVQVMLCAVFVGQTSKLWLSIEQSGTSLQTAHLKEELINNNFYLHTMDI